MLLKISIFIFIPFLFLSGQDRPADNISVKRDALINQRYAEIIEMFEREAPKNQDENVILGLALVQQAHVYQILFEFSRILLADYANHRDALDTQNRTSLNDFYKALSLFYQNDKQAVEYARRFLGSSAGFDGLRSKAEIITNPDKAAQHSTLSVLFSWMNGSRQEVPSQCSEQDEIWQQRCLFLRDFQNIQVKGPVFSTRFSEGIPVHKIEFDPYTIIEYADPADLFLLSMFRYEQFYQIALKEPALQRRIEMVEAAYVTGRHQEALQIILQAPSAHPFHPAYVAAINFHQTGSKDHFEEIMGFLSSRNPSLRAVSAHLLSGLQLDSDQKQRALARILQLPQGEIREAIYVGWSLLRLNAPEHALQWLDSIYLRSNHNNLRTSSHKMLALLSYARYLSGREYYAESLSHFVALSRNEYPLIRPFLPILQETVMPDCPECGVVR